jgi:hypothetical protein
MADSSSPEPVKNLRGKVTRGLYGKGTKSEHEATFLEAKNTRYILRRKTGPAFADRELEQYVGHEVECDGFIVGQTLLAESIRVID